MLNTGWGLCFISSILLLSFVHLTYIAVHPSKPNPKTVHVEHTHTCRKNNSGRNFEYPLLINYADGCCTVAQLRNCESGKTHGFKSCKPYTRQDLPLGAFPVGYNKIAGLKRGAGYWVWKPLVIWLTLLDAQDGAQCGHVRLGGGVHFTTLFRPRHCGPAAADQMAQLTAAPQRLHAQITALQQSSARPPGPPRPRCTHCNKPGHQEQTFLYQAPALGFRARVQG